MASQLACGVLIFNPAGELLLCHLTRTPYWDIPKGLSEAGESPQEAALREVREECGLRLGAARLRELGRFGYRRGKDLHLFATVCATVALDDLCCSSVFRDRNGRALPEVDRFAWVPVADLAAHCAPSMTKVLTQGLDLRAVFAAAADAVPAGAAPTRSAAVGPGGSCR